MIITKSIKIQINKGNIPYYKKFDDYNHIKIGEIVDIDIKYLAKSNYNKIKYICDNCGKENEISYNSYNDKRRNKNLDLCKGKCSNIKREQTNEKLYGVKNCFQNENMKEKAKETLLEKYGVDHNMKIEKCKTDRKNTYMKNYGVDNPTKNINIFEKALKTGKKIFKYKNSELYYQGSYEKDFLNKYYNKITIKNGISIKYKIDNFEKCYHTDFYLPDFDLIIEIKSTYWYLKHENINITKKLYTEKYHNYIIILNKDYDILEQIIYQKSAL